MNCESFLGFENRTFIGTAIIGLYKNSGFVYKKLNYYYKTPFIDSSGNENLTTNVTILDNILCSMELQKNNIRQKDKYIVLYEQ